MSSDGADARQRLRECEGLVDALLHALQSAVANKETDNKVSGAFKPKRLFKDYSKIKGKINPESTLDL